MPTLLRTEPLLLVVRQSTTSLFPAPTDRSYCGTAVPTCNSNVSYYTPDSLPISTGVPMLTQAQHCSCGTTTRVPALLGCQHYSGASTTRMPTLLGCQHCSAANTARLPALLGSQHCSGGSTASPTAGPLRGAASCMCTSCVYGARACMDRCVGARLECH